MDLLGFQRELGDVLGVLLHSSVEALAIPRRWAEPWVELQSVCPLLAILPTLPIVYGEVEGVEKSLELARAPPKEYKKRIRPIKGQSRYLGLPCDGKNGETSLFLCPLHQ